MVKNKKRVLILTSSGGGGHLQAAIAKRIELVEKGNYEIIQKDVFLDFLGNIAGKSFVSAWNFCQSHGKITSLYIFSISSRVVDTLFSPILFIHCLYQIKKHQIDSIIDTQPIGTKIFIRSIRLFRRITGKTVTYEKVMTDLPTKRCHHFFKPISRLSKKDKKYINLMTTKPNLENMTDDKSFWKKYTGLSQKNIFYTNYPLRPGYINPLPHKKPLSIDFNTYTPKNTHIISKCLSYGKALFQRKKNSVTINITDETLSLITLGSFPQKSVLLSYIKKYIEQKKYHQNNRRDLLFILVGPQKTAQYFYESIISLIQSIDHYPKNLTVIPLAFQDDTALAPLYYNLDFIIAKPGGLTSMEILQSIEGKIYIHNNPMPKISKILSYISSNNIDCMPSWERGNAEHLIERKKAQMIKPELFINRTNKFFKEPNSYILQNI